MNLRDWWVLWRYRIRNGWIVIRAWENGYRQGRRDERAENPLATTPAPCYLDETTPHKEKRIDLAP